MQEIAQELKEEARAEEKAPEPDNLEDSKVESEIVDYEGSGVGNNFGCKKCEESYNADERKPLVLGCGQLSAPSAVSNYSFQADKPPCVNHPDQLSDFVSLDNKQSTLCCACILEQAGT